jgi:hypothetical protein
MKIPRNNPPPLVLALQKRTWPTFTLSVFNLPLPTFLAFFPEDYQIKEMELSYKEKGKRSTTHLRLEKLSSNKVLELLNTSPRRVMSVQLQFDQNISIDSNGEDELFFTFSSSFDFSTLMHRLLSEKARQAPFIPSLHLDNFCWEIKEGQLHSYRSLDTYLRHSLRA